MLDTAPRRNNFDALRLIAALSVVFSHSFLIAEGSEANEPFVWLSGNQCILGLVGVFVFFVISGYLVTESWCRSPLPGHFALRRGLRIYPGLMVNVALCALLLGPLVTSLPLGAYFSSPELRDFVVKTVTLNPGPLALPGVLFADNAVGLHINGSLWTLRYEIMMYLMIVMLGMARLLRIYGMACAIHFHYDRLLRQWSAVRAASLPERDRERLIANVAASQTEEVTRAAAG